MTISMTGFGRATAENDEIQVKVEMKSVNNRYIDLAVKLPRTYAFAEEKLKKIIKNKINRGKVDVYVNINNISSSNAKIAVDMQLAKQYYDSINKIKNVFKIKEKIRAYNIAINPGVINIREIDIDEDKSYELIKDTLIKALNEMVLMKQVEGNNIKEDLLKKIDELIFNIEYIEKEAPVLVAEYRDKLKIKISDMLSDVNIDENRFNQEIAYFADKASIDEEIIRLKSHISQFGDELISDYTGRKLDFIIQEMNREINTIGSKANSLNISKKVLECKSIVEKLREQAMNIE